MAYCSSCMAAVDQGIRYCPSCGAPQPAVASTGKFDLGVPPPFSPPPPMGQPWDAQPGIAASTGRSVAMWSHLAPLIMWGVALLLGATGIGVVVSLLCWIPPLVMRNSATGRASQFARVHATESLNLQLTALIISLGYLLVVLLGVGMLFAGSLGGYGVIWLVVIAGLALYVFAVVQMIMGAVAAHGGRYFRYWINFRMVKP